MKLVLRAAPSSVASNVVENIRNTWEASMLTRAVGVAGFAIFSHSRLYHGYLMQVTNAFGYAIWAEALKEAKNKGDFKKIGEGWDIIYALITLAGIGLVALGHEVVMLLTNGKFTEAAFWIPLWSAYLLIQNSGKAPTAVLYAAHKGVLTLHLRILSMGVGMAGMLVAIPAFGMTGAFVVLFLEMLVFRVGIQISARRLRSLPFQDGWAFGGAALIIVLAILLAGQSFVVRMGICTLVAFIFLLLRRRLVIEMLQYVRAKIVARSMDVA